MRHFICTSAAPCALAAHALGVFMAAHTTTLIAFTGLTLQAPACAFRAAASTVTLASVAVAAHHNLCTAAGTQKHARWLFASSLRHGHLRQTGRCCWTNFVPKCHNHVALVSRTVKGAAGRNKLPRQGRRCARLLLGMVVITAHQPMAHHKPKLKRRNQGSGPRATTLVDRSDHQAWENAARSQKSAFLDSR